jgi:type IV pilus assembly protein PilM
MAKFSFKNQDLNWKKLLNLEKPQVIGLDIGSSAVRMVQLHKDNGSYTVTAAVVAEVENTMQNNMTDKDKGAVTAIRQCIDSAGIQTRYAVCGVSGPEVAVRPFKFPALPLEEVEGAVRLEAAQVCPFNVDDAAVDYQLMSDPDDAASVSGIFVAATNKLIKRKKQLVASAMLDCVLIDVDSLAILNCFTECEKRQLQRSTIAILNVGSSSTNLTIMGDNSRPFIREMQYAGNDIIKDIAQEHNLSPEAVAKALRCNGSSSLPLGGQGQPKFDDSLAKACQKLAASVTETLRYYTAQEKSTAVHEIFVCGGFSLAKGFIEALSGQLAAKTVLWNPFEKMHCQANEQCRQNLQKNGPAMAVAAGLAMRSL